MKINSFTKNHHRSHHVVKTPTKVGNLSFDDLYQEISDHWEDKARRLQARRWRMLKHQDI